MMPRERDYWLNASTIGLIFQLGVAIGVGIAIVYQVLYNDVTSHLAEYAFLKAIGYHKRYILFIVLQEAIILAVLGFIPK